MADLEKELISAVVLDGEMLPAVEAKITPDWFEGETSARAWEWALEHWLKHGEAPSEVALRRAYPTFRIREPEDPLSYLIEEMRERRKHALVIDGMSEIVDLVNEAKNDDALHRMSALVTDVSVEVSALRDTDVTKTWEQRMAAYIDARDHKGELRGWPTGFKHLDQNLGGLQDEQLITLVGLPKSGKSATELVMAIAAHDAGAECLFVGFEMSNQEQEARHDAWVASLDHWKLLHGYLDDSEMRQLRRAMKARAEMQPFIFSSDLEAHRVSDLRGLVERYNPDVLFVDGTYLMEDDRGQEKGSPQALTNITRDLKRLAQSRKIPVVQTTQALHSKTKGKVTAASVGYTGSFVQDSDVVLAVETVVNDATGKEMHNTKRISTLAARSAPYLEILVDWDWATGSFEERSASENSEGVIVDGDGNVHRLAGKSPAALGELLAEGDE